MPPAYGGSTAMDKAEHITKTVTRGMVTQLARLTQAPPSDCQESVEYIKQELQEEVEELIEHDT